MNGVRREPVEVCAGRLGDRRASVGGAPTRLLAMRFRLRGIRRSRREPLLSVSHVRSHISPTGRVLRLRGRSHDVVPGAHHDQGCARPDAPA